MILTVTLNPCLDKTVEISNFTYGDINRISKIRLDACGKGINVSIALHQLGVDTICTGFNYTDDRLLESNLENRGVTYDFVNVPGKLRTNLKVFDTSSQVLTEFNEAGGEISSEDIEKLIEKIKDYLPRIDLLVMSGSLPQGVPTNIYSKIIQIANAAGKKAILDASGNSLIEGIKAKPFLIKPNRLELEQFCGHKIESINDAVSIARNIIDSGITYVCISMGKEGALLISCDKVCYSEGANIAVKGVQGAGDSLVTGLIIAMQKNLTEPEMLHYGMAVAHGSLIHEGTQMCTSDDFAAMMNSISVKELSI